MENGEFRIRGKGVNLKINFNFAPLNRRDKICRIMSKKDLSADVAGEQKKDILHSYLETVEAMPETTFDEIVDKYVEMNRRQTESYQACLNGRGAKEEDEVNMAHPFMKGIGYSYYYEQEDQIMKKFDKTIIEQEA